MRLTVPADLQHGVWFPQAAPADTRARTVWSEAASHGAIRAAAATTATDPFAKYPEWLAPHFAERHGTFLDAGCGYGRVAIPLLRSNPAMRCVGVDASPVMLNRFVELARDHRVKDRVELYCGNLDSLPFPDAHFDVVLSCAVLLHLPKAEVRHVLREFTRVLAPNGTLILAGTFPNVLNPEGVINIPNNFRAAQNGPVRVYTRREVTRLFGDFSRVTVTAHQMIVLPRSVGSITLPFAHWSRRANRYCSERFIDTFAHSGWLVNHHDVVATK